MLLLLTWVGVALAPGVPPRPPPSCPVTFELAEKLNPSPLRFHTACSAEIKLAAAGWERPLVAGALANAWHESGWNPSAKGDRGRAVGFWQLHSRGLGKDMGAARLDIGISTDRVIRAADKLGVSSADYATPGQASDVFCQRIMRPDNLSDNMRKRRRTAALVN
jgi:hypothetical protein